MPIQCSHQSSNNEEINSLHMSMCMVFTSLLLGFLLGNIQDWELVLDHLTASTKDEATSSSYSEQVTYETHTSVQVTSDPNTSAEQNTNPHTVEQLDSDTSHKEVSWSALVSCMVQTLNPQDISSLLAAHPHTLLGGGDKVDEERELHSLLVAAASLHTQQR